MNSLEEAKQALINLLTDKVVAYHVEYANIGGGATSGLFLSQLLYWYGKGSDKEEGWIYKTQAEWTEETGLTRREQETARNRLKKKGILKEKRDGMPARLFFLPNIETIISLLSKQKHPTKPRQIIAKHECTKPPIKNGGNVHSRMAESANQETPRKPAPAVAPTFVAEGPEITIETTTDIINGSSENSSSSHKDEDDDNDIKQNKDNQQHPIVKSSSGPLEINDSYFISIEEKLSKLNIRQVLSPVESRKMQEMKLAGIPLNLVLKTIDEVVRNAKGKKIRSFNYFVDSIWEKFNAAPAPYDMADANKRQSDLLQKAKEAGI